MKKYIYAAIVFILTVFAFAMFWYFFYHKQFRSHPFPLKASYRLFDVAILDINNDNNLDVLTTNHHYRQSLLLNDGRGSFRAALSELGLDHNPDFPGLEYSLDSPTIDQPGLYIYYRDSDLVLCAHNLNANAQGNIRLHSAVTPVVEVKSNDSFSVEIDKDTIRSGLYGASIRFAAQKNGRLSLFQEDKAMFVSIELADTIPLNHVYVGQKKTSPRSNSFYIGIEDRHGMAAADLNGDGQMDLFFARGGNPSLLSDSGDDEINDELLVSRATGGYRDLSSQLGIVKGWAVGYDARFVDYNKDDRLDLFVSCRDLSRGRHFPNRLYRQDGNGQFIEAAKEAGLELPGVVLHSIAWMDADNDGDIDLLATQNNGIWLYRNNNLSFEPERLYAGRSVDMRESSWMNDAFKHSRFDNKITVSDYDSDGDLDAFIASTSGNVLLLNEKGKYQYVSPTSVGLPAVSLAGDWVDYDNDGMPDMHTVPGGLYRQNMNHRFERTNLLDLSHSDNQGALCHWFDMDNDGYRDLLMMLRDDLKTGSDQRWSAKIFRNVGAKNHWLQVKLIGKKNNRQALGARVTVVTPGLSQVQEVGCNDGAYFSQGHYRLYFGLGRHEKAELVRVCWPDGHLQELTDVRGDILLVVEREKQDMP